MRKWKKKTLAMLCASAMLVTAACSSPTSNQDASTEAETTTTETTAETGETPAAGGYQAGTYEAEVSGHNGPIKVAVTVDDSSIVNVEIVEHTESAGISDPAINTIPQAIVDGQTLAVDMISGCTVTCEAIVNAAEAALTDAGADIEALKVKKAAAVDQTEKELVEKEADVIVIGGGLAGLSAATTVAEAGSTVIVIDKMPNIGGNTTRSGGTLNAVDPARQEPQGIEDSVELFIQNTYDAGDQKGNMDLIRVMCENSESARYWISEHGGKWQEKIYLTVGGLFPRSMDAENNPVETFIDPLTKAITDNGGEILVNVKAEELIQEDGRVTGVKATGTDGTPYIFTGTKGIVMATGGFGANSEMVAQYSDTIPENNPTTNTPAATGDGIVMGEAVNANLVGMEYIQMLPNPGTNVYFTGEIENSIYVNKNGERFVSEQGRRDVLCNAILAQPDSVMFAIFDSKTINDEFKSNQDGSQDYVQLAKEGKCGYGETLEELAESVGVDPEGLVKSVEEFNAIVRGEAEDPFGRELFYEEISDGPFYASIRTARTHHTMGGLEINTRAQVIDKEGNPIAGLYAAGEVTGGIHGSNRIGGNALTDCVVFGRIAGDSILADAE